MSTLICPICKSLVEREELEKHIGACIDKPEPISEGERESRIRKDAHDGVYSGVFHSGGADVLYLLDSIIALRRDRDEARANADFLRDSLGECHLMISRNTPEFQLKQEWDATSLPARLQKILEVFAALKGKP